MGGFSEDRAINCTGLPDRRVSDYLWLTRQAFGKAIWPHLFRDCAVTELVDCETEEIGIPPDLLDNADLQTTKKHYIQAVGMKAPARVQEVIAARRRAAARRE